MTENRRIVLNVVATYGRSLYGLALGLLCGRWAYLALGEVDYGLNGLVGGLAVFITFFNGVLSGANARFYAFSVGAAKVAEDKEAALEECRRWFNTALSVHSAIPILLVMAGYPVGVCAIERWLTIPAERISDCVWVFRFVCISCFVGMVNVPFTAMYTAKQYIAELTLYSFLTSTLNVVMLGYMVTHPSQWLVGYAAWACFLVVAPQVAICIRAMVVFPECRVKWRYMWDWTRLRKLGAFSMWQLLGVVCGVLRTSGMSIVVNKLFGATMNAAQAVGNTVQGQCNSLAGAMQGAFTPVITQACGAREYGKMKAFALRTCKFNVFLYAVFAIPLALELPEVMRLWLKTPPDFAAGLCLCAMLYNLVGSCTVGHMIVVIATGRIVPYYVGMSLISVFTLPLAVAAGLVWRNVYAAMGVVIVMEVLNSAGRVYFARRLADMSARAWLNDVMVPFACVVAATVAFGLAPRLFMEDSLARVCLTTLCCELVFVPLAWHCALSRDERAFFADKIAFALRKVRNRA